MLYHHKLIITQQGGQTLYSSDGFDEYKHAQAKGSASQAGCAVVIQQTAPEE